MDINNIISIIIVAGIFAYIIHKKKKKAQSLKAEKDAANIPDNPPGYMYERYGNLGSSRYIHGVSFVTVPIDLMEKDADIDGYADYDLKLETMVNAVISALTADNRKILSVAPIARGDRIIFCILY